MAESSAVRFRMTGKFEKWVEKNRLQGAPFDALIAALQADPTAGDVVPGSGGLRKIRMAGGGRGKRGGFRVVYTVVLAGTWLVLLRGYSKSELAKLPEREMKRLQKIAESMEGEIRDSLKNPSTKASQ